MRCPVCKSEMLVLELEQVEIDYCMPCNGVWLDEGELELLLEGPGANVKLLENMKRDESGTEKSRPCPRCKKKMHKVFFGDHEDVLLDKCRKGHGLWFDAGELHSVANLTFGGEQTRIVRLLQEMFAYDLKK